MVITSRLVNHPAFAGKSSLAVAIFLILSLFPCVPALSYEAASIPWSGYWWPVFYGGLGTGLDYRGRPAPIEKYNLLTTGVTSGEALTEYLKEYYDPSEETPEWYGLCMPWALAASFEHIDILPSSEENLVFRVGDKKGLLTLAHDRDILEYGDGSDPAVFHFWLLNYIMDQKKAFVADLSTGTEMWSFPIYKYEMSSSRSGNIESVSVRVYYADDSVRPDYIGTDIRSYTYTYNLILNPSGEIAEGKWTGKSETNHPEGLSFSLGVGDNFPGLDYQEIVRLAKSKDDFLENGNEPVNIYPGTYHLILLDEDVYTIPGKSGDILSLTIEKEKGSTQDIAAVLTDANGDEVLRRTVDDGDPVDEDPLTFTTPPYTIRLTQEDGTYATDPNIYTLKVDLKKSFDREIPYIPKMNDWSGFALTNPGSLAVDGITLTTRDANGMPIQTVMAPLRLEPHEKRTFLFSDLPVRLTELPTTKRLSLTADEPVDFLNVIGEENYFLTTFVQGNSRGSWLVIPDTTTPMTPGVRMFGGVRNESYEEAQVSLYLYSSDGLLHKDVSKTIPARGYLSIDPGSDPFYKMPESGWIEIKGNGNQVLSGFQYTSNASGVETSFALGVESLFALPVGATKKIVSHIAEQGYWITKVTLINPGDEENPVRLHLALAGEDTSGDFALTLGPREKNTLELQDLFGKIPGDPLYHSILEITGRYPFVGYVTYSVPGGNDHARYPLLDESSFKSELNLPHYTGNDGHWWTGVVICNPSTFPVTVMVEPYDHNGALMENDIQQVSLNRGAYDVFDVASRFVDSESEISFLKFLKEGDSGAISGFYLYGDHGNHILSGANME